MDKFELYCNRNIFVLPEIKESENQSDIDNKLKSVNEEVGLLKKHYLDSRRLHSSYTVEHQEAEALLYDMSKTLFNIQVGAQVFEQFNIQPLSESMENLSQTKKSLEDLMAKATGNFLQYFILEIAF